MKLLAIRGRNLNSLADPFEIDFTAPPLSASGLFAVTGPTGAGKSTLLDALCLALYGALPRLEGAPRGAGSDPDLKTDDARNALRQGAGEGYAEVDFIGRAEAGAGGAGGRRGYRARWEARRARGKPGGALQPARMRLFDLESGAPIADKLTETREAIVARVGLSFEQFKRSALLAQGEFEAFLAADGKERAALLERITGGEIFGLISQAAHQRKREEESAIAALEAGAAAHRPLEPEARIAAEKRKAEAGAAARESAERRNALLAAEVFLVEARRLAQEKSLAEADREAASRRLASVAAAAHARLEAQAEAVERDRASLDAEAALRPWGARLAAQLPQTEAALSAVADAMKSKKALEKSLEEIEAARKSGDEAMLGLRNQLASRAEAVKARRKAAEAARKAVAALGPEKIERAAATGRAASEAFRKLEAPLDRWFLAGEDMAAAKARGAKTRQGVEQAATRLQEAEAQAPEIEAAFAAAKSRLEIWRAALSDAAEGLRAELREGEPCPVCGARDHATAKLTAAAKRAEKEEETRLRAASAARDASLALRAAAKAEHAAAEKAAEAAQREIDNAAKRRDAARRDAEAALTPWSNLAARLGAETIGFAARNIASAFGEDGAEADAGAMTEARAALEREVDQRVDAIDAEAERLRAAQKAAGEAEGALRAEEDAAGEAREKLDAAREAQDARASRLDRAKAELADVKEKGAGAAALLDNVFAGFLENWRERPIAETRNAAQAEAAAEAQRRRRLTELAERAPRIAAERKALSDLLAGRPIKDETAEEELADRPDAPAPGFAEASAAADALTRAEARAEEAARAEQRLLAEPPAAAEAFREDPDGLAEARETAASTAAAATEALETASLALREDDAVRQRLGAAQQAIQERRAKAEVWLKLDMLIGSADGSKFRRFAQSLTLQTLAALASRRLLDLAPRYALEAAPSDPAEPDLALVAVDRDMGDARRPVRQLSGGERFLTSLALALALADLSSEQGVVVDSLFIDEGFGALDADSLGMALSALEALQATGRQVGVVTHVEALSERIAARIAVEPQGGGKSRVRVLGP